MTTPPRTVSVLGALTASALGVVLLIGSCEVPVPIAIEPERQDDIVQESEDDTVHILIGRDGFFYVNGEPHAIEDLSAVLAPLYSLYSASGPVPVTSIRGDRDVPYQLVDRLQQELVAAGAVRVVLFLPPDSLAPSPPNDVRALRDQGLAMVLPAQMPEGVQISQRNIMHLVVQPSGLVEVRRGESSQVQTIRPQDVEIVWRRDVANNPNLIAAVKIHPDAPHRLMIEVLDALHAANAERISLQVLEN